MKKYFYEFTYIISSTVADEDRENIVKKLDQVIASHEGEIEETDHWGLKTFAYPIKKQRSGYYINQYFTALASAVPALEKAIKIDENIVRFMVLKYDNKMKKHHEMRKKGTLPDIFAVQEEEEV